MGIKIVIPVKRLIFGGHVKLRKSLRTRVNIWVSTILNHINTGMVLPRYEGSCIYIDLNVTESKITAKYRYPTCIEKCEILFVKTRVVFKKTTHIDTGIDFLQCQSA